MRAEIDEDGIKKAYRNFLQNNERFYYITILIEVYAPDKKGLQEKVNEVKTLLAAYGMTRDDLIYEQQPSFLSVLPYTGSVMQHMRRNLPSSTAAALFPFSASSLVDPEGMPLGTTTDSGPVIIDFFKRDDSNANGNITIIGESGQGKSTLMKKIIEMCIVLGISVYFIDPEAEYCELIYKLGGTVIDCASGGFMINPLEIRTIATRGDDENLTKEEKAESQEAFKQVNPIISP